MCTAGTSSESSLMAMFAHDLLSLTRFLTTHPVHSAYLLFFSPYILSLLSFLSPLLLSTLLSLLALLTVSPYYSSTDQDPSSFELLGIGMTCGVALRSLRIVPGGPPLTGSIGMLQELDDMVLSPIAQALSEVQLTTDQEEVLLFIDSCSVVGGESDQPLMAGGDYEEKKGCDHVSIGEFDHDYMSCASDDVEGNNHPKKNVNSEDFVPDGGGNGIVKEGSLTRSMSTNRAGDYARTPSSSSSSSQGFQREWKRTLACKLYEERITSKLREEGEFGEDDHQEMDLIWEAIEVNSNKDSTSTHGEGDDEEEEEEEMPVRQLCCLQAFRVSTRKMNLGVGRVPNLLKLSKVLKKMSVFNVSSTRRSSRNNRISEEKEVDVINSRGK